MVVILVALVDQQPDIGMVVTEVDLDIRII
jgi:hypothetical protein